MGIILSHEELGKQLAMEDDLESNLNRSVMLVHLGQRFPLIPAPSDFITDIYGDEAIEEPDGITWTETHLIIHNLPRGKVLEGNFYVEEDVDAVIPPVPTLDGRMSRKPLMIYLQVDEILNSLVNRLGCRVYYTDKQGEERVLDLQGELRTYEGGSYLHFAGAKGVSLEDNPWQITISQRKKKLINAATAAGLEAEFYLGPRIRRQAENFSTE